MNLNVIKTLTIRSKEEGAAQTTAALKGVESAYKGVAEVSDKSAKGQLSLADAVAKAERRFNSSIRAQQDFEKVQRQMNMAVAQNPALQERVNKVLADARVHFDQVSRGQRTFAAATQAANDNLRGFAQSAGPLGSVLATLGPGGIAAAAGIGAAALAIHQMVTAATNLAERAGKLKDFAETTGLTVVQLQALEKAGAQVGITSDKLNSSLERFSVQMDDAGKSTGPLYEQLLAINPALASQVARARSLAEAWDLIAEATKNASNEQRNAIAKAAFGRGGIEITRLQSASAQASGIQGLVSALNKADTITAQQAERWDTLGDKIAENMKAAKQNIAATFTGPALEAMNDYTAGLLRLSRMAREASESGLGDAVADWTVKILKVVPVVGLVVRGLETLRGLGKDAGSAKLSSIDPGFDPGNSSFDAAAVQQERLRKEIILTYNETKRWMDVLGSAATASERLTEEQQRLAAEVAKGNATQDQANRALARYNEEAAKSALSARISLLGDLATKEEIAKQKQNEINEANLKGAGITLQQAEALKLRAQRQHELNTAQGQIKFDRDTMFLSDTDRQIAQALAKDFKTVEEALNSDQAAAMRLNAALKTTNDVLGEGASSIIKDWAHGISIMDALRSAAGKFGDQLIDIGSKRLVSMGLDQAASMFGAGSAAAPAAILNTTAVTMGATWITSAQISAGILAGESVQEATARVTSAQVAAGTLKVGGLEAGLLMNGPMMLLMAAIVAVGSLLNMWSSGSAKAKQEEEAQAKAWEAWEAAGHQFETWTARMTGGSVGTIATRATDAAGEAQRLIKLRSEAMGFKSAQQENADPVIQKIKEDLGKFNTRIIQEFEKTFPDLIAAMKSGLGPDSPFFQALQQMRDLGEKAKEFIADAEFVWGKGSGQADQARKASQEFLLAQINPQQDMSATEKAMAELQGKAKALQEVLVSLGMSSEEAARRINEGVKKSIDALKKAFGEDLQRQINDLSGKGFLNDAFDLIKKNAERLKDDKALGGGNKDLIDQLFGLSAQDIINKFQLTGDAFAEFIKQFPELAGKLKEFDDVAGKAGLRDRIFNANLGDSDADKRAAFERNAERERLDAAKKGAEYLILLEQALGAERARLEREIQERIMNERRALEDRLFNAGNDTSTLAGKLAEFDRKAAREREEAAKRGNNNVVDAEKIITIGRLAAIEDFKNNALQLEKEINKGRLEIMGDGLNRLGAPIQDGINRHKGRPEEDEKDNILLLDEVLARERLRIIEDFNKAALEAEQKRIQSFRDRVFNALNDATTLEGQLTAFDRQARREREEEALAGGGAMADLELALAAERFNIIKNFNDRAIAEEKRAAEERQRAIESAARNIADYLQNLVAGPNSTLSPQDRFAAAQLQYQSTLALAQAGNVDALQKITQDAENYRTAARDMFGSAAAYQDVFQLILSELSGLPAVASSTDPVVQSILDLIGVVQSGIDTQATEVTLAGAVKNAIDAGNASQTAASLLPMFNNLNTTVDQGLTVAELQAAGLSTESGNLKKVFDELDNNGNGILEKSELIKAATQGTKTGIDGPDGANALLDSMNSVMGVMRDLIITLNAYIGEDGNNVKSGIVDVRNAVGQARQSVIEWGQFNYNAMLSLSGFMQIVNTTVATSAAGVATKVAEWGQFNANAIDSVSRAIDSVSRAVDSVSSAVDSVSRAVADVNEAIGTGGGSNSLQALNTTANSTLKFLTDQLQVTSQTHKVGIDQTFGGGESVTLNNAGSVIAVLGIIAFNTYAIAINTKKMVSGGQGPIGYADGGVIPPFGLGLVSEHLNPKFLRAGAEPITVSPFSPANDNGQWSAVLAELRELRKEVASFRKENGVNTTDGANLIREGIDKNTHAVRADSKEQATGRRQETKRARVAA